MYRIISIFLMALLFLPSEAVWAKGQVRAKGDIEIFAGGERYGSLYAYKLRKLKRLFEETFPVAMEEEFETFLEAYLKDFPVHLRKKFDLKDIKRISREVYDLRHRSIPEPDSDPQIAEMQKMLEDYAQEHGSAESLVIDPKEVKTVIIGSPLETEKVPSQEAVPPHYLGISY